MVYTATLGEHGYLRPRHPRNDHGPAVVAPLTALGLSTRINDRFEILKVTDRGLRPDWFPVGTCARALEVVDELAYLRPLRGVCHTPIARPDGGLLADPG